MTGETKVCNKCGEEKELNEFSFRRDNGKYRNECKKCKILYNKKYYFNNSEEIIKTIKEYNNKNKSDKTKYIKEYYTKNKKKIISTNLEYYNKNKKYLKYLYNLNRKKRRVNDPLFKLRCNINRAIHRSFKSKGYIKSDRTVNILGCSAEFFKLYIESKFESWMSWDNYGKYNGTYNYGWDIDHIIPISSAKTEGEIINLNHYTNLRPLCSYVNRYVKKNNILN